MPTPTSNQNATPTPLIEPTNQLTSTPPQNNPTPTTKPEGNNNNGFIYPGATLKSNSSGNLILESNDSPDTITDWYKNEIKNQGVNVTSFVTTKTNGNVLNKLAGANGEKEINVEIERKEGTSTTLIQVKQN